MQRAPPNKEKAFSVAPENAVTSNPRAVGKTFTWSSGSSIRQFLHRHKKPIFVPIEPDPTLEPTMATSISLTDFADFVMKVGPSQLAKVKELAKRGDYHPAYDYWKGLREGIQRFHAQGHTDRDALDRLMEPITDRKKVDRYLEAIKSYKKFLGRKKLDCFPPSRDTWHFRELQVRINPELGLVIDGTRYLVKLYFKGEPLDAHKLKLVFTLMQSCLSPAEVGVTKMAVIDVQNGKIHIQRDFDPAYIALLEAQALSFIHIWNAVEAAKQKSRSA